MSYPNNVGECIPYWSPNVIKRVYISTPLSGEKFQLGTIQEQILAHKVFAFIPTTATTTPESAAALNKLMIEQSDEVWVFGPIGRDCSWEIGYAQGRGIKVVFFKSEINQDRIDSDWMLFCAGTQIIDIRKRTNDIPF